MEKPNIIEIMKKSCNYSFSLRSNTWITEILNNDEDSAWFIIPENYLKRQQQEVEKLKEVYNLSAICQLGNIYNETAVTFLLINATKEDVSEVFYSYYEKKTHNRSKAKKEKNGDISLVDIFTDEYLEYLNALEEWLSGKEIDFKEAEFKKIPIKELENGNYNPAFYTDKAISIRKLLKKEKVLQLQEVAEIIRPSMKQEVVGKCITIKDFQYPMVTAELESRKTNGVKLKKGDILLPEMAFDEFRPYLFNGAKEDVFTASHMYIIRCKDIAPEYLYLYLSSDTAKCVFNTCSYGAAVNRLSFQNISKFPVILPKKDSQQYVAEFEMITSTNVRVYQKNAEERLKAYLDAINEYKSQKVKAKDVEDILNIEIANTIKANNEEQLRSFLTDDLQELNICYKNKAYKATLILAGSILEAVLIDWLSEIKGVDYFKEDYIVTDKRTGRNKKAELIDYINEIKYIERPHWMEEADKAHEIRKKRNLVHAKLCMNSNDVNEEVCKDVIGYLKDVLKTRGVK